MPHNPSLAAGAIDCKVMSARDESDSEGHGSFPGDASVSPTSGRFVEAGVRPEAR